MVVQDVLYGYITLEAARRDYGVAVDEYGHVDEEETARLRSIGRWALPACQRGPARASHETACGKAFRGGLLGRRLWRY
jgi:hypothetical protein